MTEVLQHPGVPPPKKKKKKVRFNLPDGHKKSVRVVPSKLEIALRHCIKGTAEMFLSNYGLGLTELEDIAGMKLKLKIHDEYEAVKNIAASKPVVDSEPSAKKSKKSKKKSEKPVIKEVPIEPFSMNLTDEHKINLTTEDDTIEGIVDTLAEQGKRTKRPLAGPNKSGSQALVVADQGGQSRTLGLRRKRPRAAKPTWHAPWKLYKVISGHTGWVRSLAVDVSNEWFATGGGAADRTVKIWDLASGTLRLTLTGHISDVRGLCVSKRYPLLFSVGADKTVKCWDLEQNKVIRSYHGHLSGVYCCALHPSLGVLFTGGRDSTCRVWDIRTKASIHVLCGHKNTVASVVSQSTTPQVITGSHDQMIRCWDLAAGKTLSTLTNHKKAIRGLTVHPTEYTFASGAADNIKVWKCPDGVFMRNMGDSPGSVVNTVTVNSDNVLVSGHDDGYLKFWDWTSGYNFQSYKAPPQPGSLESEAGIQASSFDMTGSRLITCETDKTIKIWKEDENATEQTHPIGNWRSNKRRARY